ncbi:PIR protein [Plasmodium vivax]|nr:PIR protein [Plasmodium vivax]CAI7724215.1 PIR protein [Plasmodium vivax]
MSYNIIDIEEWKQKYPFLNTVWNKYNEFDNSVDGDQYKHRYEAFCKPLMKKLVYNNEDYESFCLKLIRNLGHYSEKLKFLRYKSEDCNNLNNWVNNSIKKYKIPDNIITECFNDYTDVISKTGREHRCAYFSYEYMYEEPINIIILNIFGSNMNVIHNALDRSYNSINLPLQMYICECIKIYKEMYKKHCHNKYDNDPKRILTCNNLNAVKSTYDIYLSGKPYKDYKIPPLDKDEVEYLTMCQPDTPRSALTEEMAGKITALQDSTEDGRRNSDGIRLQSPVTGENQGSSMSRTVSTAVGTVAGASSILALLYKFTPGRKLIHSGFRGGRRRTSSNIYDEPYELFFDGMEHNGFNSYNIGYEAA